MPPRAMWRGAISFGLVTIPVSVYPATEEKSLRFNQLHDADHGRIRYQRVCSVCGEEVEYDHIVRGYEVEKDRYVVLTDEDLESVPVRSSRSIDIEQFVDLAEIDPVLYKRSYYLVPEETGAKAYALLRRALAEENKVGIAKVSFRDKEHLAALRFKDGVFVLETMYWPDEIRAADFEVLEREKEIRPKELAMAKQLIESLSEPWDPTRYRDEYREALLELVEKKLAGEPIEVPEEAPPAPIVDLMAALKASVEAAKARAAEEPAAAGRGAGRTSRRKPSTEPGASGRSRARPSKAQPASKKARKRAVGE